MSDRIRPAANAASISDPVRSGCRRVAKPAQSFGRWLSLRTDRSWGSVAANPMPWDLSAWPWATVCAGICFSSRVWVQVSKSTTGSNQRTRLGACSLLRRRLQIRCAGGRHGMMQFV